MRLSTLSVDNHLRNLGMHVVQEERLSYVQALEQMLLRQQKLLSNAVAGTSDVAAVKIGPKIEVDKAPMDLHDDLTGENSLPEGVQNPGIVQLKLQHLAFSICIQTPHNVRMVWKGFISILCVTGVPTLANHCLTLQAP
jgi:hypothetical protein